MATPLGDNNTAPGTEEGEDLGPPLPSSKDLFEKMLEDALKAGGTGGIGEDNTSKVATDAPVALAMNASGGVANSPLPSPKHTKAVAVVEAEVEQASGDKENIATPGGPVLATAAAPEPVDVVATEAPADIAVQDVPPTETEAEAPQEVAAPVDDLPEDDIFAQRLKAALEAGDGTGGIGGATGGALPMTPPGVVKPFNPVFVTPPSATDGAAAEEEECDQGTVADTSAPSADDLFTQRLNAALAAGDDTGGIGGSTGGGLPSTPPGVVKPFQPVFVTPDAKQKDEPEASAADEAPGAAAESDGGDSEAGDEVAKSPEVDLFTQRLNAALAAGDNTGGIGGATGGGLPMTPPGVVKPMPVILSPPGESASADTDADSKQGNVLEAAAPETKPETQAETRAEAELPEDDLFAQRLKAALEAGDTGGIGSSSGGLPMTPPGVVKKFQPIMISPAGDEKRGDGTDEGSSSGGGVDDEFSKLLEKELASGGNGGIGSGGSKIPNSPPRKRSAGVAAIKSTERPASPTPVNSPVKVSTRPARAVSISEAASAAAAAPDVSAPAAAADDDDDDDEITFKNPAAVVQATTPDAELLARLAVLEGEKREWAAEKARLQERNADAQVELTSMTRELGRISNLVAGLQTRVKELTYLCGGDA